MKRTMRITVTNSFGKWVGKNLSVEDEDTDRILAEEEYYLPNLRDTLLSIDQELVYELETDGGFVYFPNKLLIHSVVELEVVEG
jgi:hypothetical protein